jgi:cytochrome c oxidase subunit II
MRFTSLSTVLLMGVATLGLCPGAGPAQPANTISIEAHRFAFEPSEITVKKGQEVTLEIHSEDVSHGLVIEELGVRTEIQKGKTAEVKFDPEAIGTFEGRCAHFCGAGHGSMTLVVHVVE